MTPYLIVFFTVAAGNFLPNKKTHALNWLSWRIVFLLLTFFLGFRFEIGADWAPYFSSFQSATGNGLIESVKWQSDPLYWILNWLAANSGLGIASLNTVIAGILVSGIMSLSARQPLPWLALTISVPYILFIVGMGYVRQSAALGFLALALVALSRDKPVRFILLVLLATLFHLSAVFYVLLLPLGSPRRKWWHLPLIVISTLPIVQSLVLDKFARSYATYLEVQRDSAGAAIRLAMNVPPALLALFSQRWLRLPVGDGRYWFWIGLGVMMLFPLSMISSTAADRVGVYLMLIQPAILSRVPLAISDRLVRSAVALGIMALYLLVLVVWLTYADKASFWVPYHDVLGIW